MSLSGAERTTLLGLARRAIEAHLTGGRPPEPESLPPALERHAGCFVSLHAGPELRGCIGTFSEDRPLHRAVREMAIAAATEDPRFPPVAPAELAGLTLEISVLTPRRTLSRADEVEVGRHGLWVERGPNRGVLLPQVATEAGWDRETFLAHTCRKAGLPMDAWRDPATRIAVFEAEVFGEEGRHSSR
jgi:hypothetical protein